MILLGPEVGYHFIQVITLGMYSTYSIIHTCFPFFFIVIVCTVRVLVCGYSYACAKGKFHRKKTPICVWVHRRNRVASTTPSHLHVQSLLHVEERSSIHHDNGRGPPRPHTVQERSCWCHT